jgi:hypothetical protein
VVYNLEGTIPEIRETDEDKKLSIDGLRRFYKDFALKDFRHFPFINKKNTPGIENISYFDYICKVNCKPYTVRLILKKALGDDVRFFYYYKLAEG